MFAGLIPFALGAIAAWFEFTAWWVFPDVPTALALYALAIASFMSGIHWAIAQTHAGQSGLLLHSNVMVVLPWVIFLVSGDSAIFYLCLIWVFIKQYLVDRMLVADGTFSSAYLTDRLVVTSIVCFMILSVAVFKLM